MDANVVQQIVDLQQKISVRLEELGYENGHSAENISHHLAEIAVLGRAFAEHTLPLFIGIDLDHHDSVGQLIMSIKCDLEEIQDSLLDVDSELRDLMAFVQGRMT